MIQSEIYRGRARTVEDAVEAWKAHYLEADEVKDVEAIVLEVLSAFDLLRRWQEDAWKLLRTGKLKNVLEMGRKLDNAYKTGKILLAIVKDCMGWAERKGYIVDNAESFRKACRELESLWSELKANWPCPDKQKIEAGLASLDRGDGVEIGGWLSELQGKDRSATER
jgi:hypothetical protein